MSFQLSGQTGLFLAILKISAVSLKYHIFEDAFFICIIISTGSLAKQVKKVVFLHSVAFVLNSKIKVGKNDNFVFKMYFFSSK